MTTASPRHVRGAEPASVSVVSASVAATARVATFSGAVSGVTGGSAAGVGRCGESVSGTVVYSGAPDDSQGGGVPESAEDAAEGAWLGAASGGAGGLGRESLDGVAPREFGTGVGMERSVAGLVRFV
ncbi:hypothetical protein [Nocardia sp. CNY236]|uniref:hypothetical protein n=1 Tax=Nocardia sp. CNY236 TaxID=1169152 RepID=UPI0012DC4364|nr:hypothetical protein [Nocardia sp. CNY236]